MKRTTDVQEIESAKRGNLGQLLLRAARLYNETCVERVQEFEPRFSVAHTKVFPFLPLEGGIRPTELADKLAMSKQAVNQLLNDLEGMEILERCPDPTDGRARLVRITEHGREYMLQGLGVLKGLERDLADALSQESVEQLKGHLQDVLSFLEE